MANLIGRNNGLPDLITNNHKYIMKNLHYQTEIDGADKDEIEMEPDD